MTDWETAALIAEVGVLREALEKIAFMGGEPRYKSPEAQVMAEIARDALARTSA